MGFSKFRSEKFSLYFLISFCDLCHEQKISLMSLKISHVVPQLL